MQCDFDFNAILQQYINQQLKDSEAKPFVELANKYGICGIKAMEFMADLATVLQQFQKDDKSNKE
jgi:hypothetical protein